MMKRILLVDDISDHVTSFKEHFGSRYNIDSASSVQSAIKFVEEKAGEYDLFVLDANLPYEDGGLASNPEAWKQIVEAIIAKIGQYAKWKTIIRTVHDKDVGAVGTSYHAIPKGWGLNLFEIAMEQMIFPDPCQPNVLIVMRETDETLRIEEFFRQLGAYTSKAETAIDAFEKLKKKLYHLLIVQLDLPGETLSSTVSQLLPDSPLQSGLSLINKVNKCFPFTMNAALYKSEKFEEGLSRAFRWLRTSETMVIGNDKLETFTANCYKNLRTRLNKLVSLGERLEKNQPPILPDISEVITLYTGDSRSYQKQDIQRWLQEPPNQKVLLLATPTAFHNPIISSLCETLTKQENIYCKDVSFSNKSMDEIVQSMDDANEYLNKIKRPTCLGIYGLFPNILEHEKFIKSLRYLLENNPDVRIMACIETGYEQVIQESFKKLFQRHSSVMHLPIIKNLSQSELQAIISSFSLALGTHRKQLNFSIDESILGFIKNEKGEHIASDLWPILARVFTLSTIINENEVKFSTKMFSNALSMGDELEASSPPPFKGDTIEIDDKHKQILQKLFAEYAEINQAFPLGSGGMSGAKLYLVQAKKQINEISKKFPCPSRVVKVNIRRKILTEFENYKKYVEPFHDRNIARIVSCVEQVPLGAIAYSLVRRGGERNKLLDLSEYFRQRNTDKYNMRDVINFLFARLLDPNWYSISKEDYQGAGFNWFYGKHLPPLLEVKIQQKSDLFISNESEKWAGDASDEVWEIVNKLQTSDKEVCGELMNLGQVVVPYKEEQDRKSTIIATHKCGAEIEIKTDQSDWEYIQNLAKNFGNKSFNIGVRGTFQTRQKELLMDIASAGFADIQCDLNLMEEKIVLGDVETLNPFSLYQDYLKDKKRIPQDRGIIHGDLHWRNVLVENGHTRPTAWLIDFGHTGYGPIIFDAIELETDLLVSVLPLSPLSSGKRLDYKDVAMILQDVKRCRRYECPDDPVLIKTLLTIKKIRDNIEYFIPMGSNGKDWKTYYIGLSLFSLGILRHYQDVGDTEDEKNKTNLQRRICFMIAAKAAEFAQREG